MAEDARDVLSFHSLAIWIWPYPILASVSSSVFPIKGEMIKGTMISLMLCGCHEHQMKWDVKWGQPALTPVMADKKPATKMLFGVSNIYSPLTSWGFNLHFCPRWATCLRMLGLWSQKDALLAHISFHPGFFLHQWEPIPWVASHPVTPLLSPKGGW